MATRRTVLATVIGTAVAAALITMGTARGPSTVAVPTYCPLVAVQRPIMFAASCLPWPGPTTRGFGARFLTPTSPPLPFPLPVPLHPIVNPGTVPAHLLLIPQAPRDASMVELSGFLIARCPTGHHVADMIQPTIRQEART